MITNNDISTGKHCEDGIESISSHRTEPPRNVLLTIAYDGSGFSGWQRQPDKRTVQGELERVLSHLCGEEIALAGVSRTDAGVHALGQCASLTGSFGIPAERIPVAANALLEDIRIISAEEMPPGFRLRAAVRAKTYVYRLAWAEAGAPAGPTFGGTGADRASGPAGASQSGRTTGPGRPTEPAGFAGPDAAGAAGAMAEALAGQPAGPAAASAEASVNPSAASLAPMFLRNYFAWLPAAPDAARVRAAAAALIGTHDFAAFQSAGGSPRETTVRTIYSIDITPASSPLEPSRWPAPPPVAPFRIPAAAPGAVPPVSAVADPLHAPIPLSDGSSASSITASGEARSNLSDLSKGAASLSDTSPRISILPPPGSPPVISSIPRSEAGEPPRIPVDPPPGTTGLDIVVTGDGFLYNMVRIIAGTLIECGLDQRDPAELPEILRSANRSRAGHTAPPQGLYLKEVFFVDK